MIINFISITDAPLPSTAIFQGNHCKYIHCYSLLIHYFPSNINLIISDLQALQLEVTSLQQEAVVAEAAKTIADREARAAEIEKVAADEKAAAAAEAKLKADSAAEVAAITAAAKALAAEAGEEKLRVAILDAENNSSK